MSLDPISVVDKLKKQYKEYLCSQFYFRNDKLNIAAEKAIEKESDLFHGPYIEANMPYATAHTFEELVDSGLLEPNIKKAFTEEEFSKYKRYIHQEQAFNLISKGKNAVISSGTGSGKTECFLVPVINELLLQKKLGKLCPGIRALLVYPMNALANDQMDRLRVALKDLPEITFGRYIGETSRSNRKEAEKEYIREHDGNQPLKNELLTRGEMHQEPPHILVTNYAMLEFMLLRPEVNTIFQGEYANNFKYLVLDEAHTYRGAHGTEVAMLIRRLKERIFGKSDNCLNCIATSATLSGGNNDMKGVVLFAKQLFSENFDEESIVQSTRKELSCGSNNSYPIEIYDKITNYYLENDVEGLKSLLQTSNNNIDDIVYDFLFNDELTYKIRKIITSEVLTINEIADKISGEDIDINITKRAIVNIIELGSKTIDKNNGLPLINAKYHVFARSIEGGFCSFYPQIKVFTERHKEYNGAPVYELMSCIRCGQEYIVGVLENEIKSGDEYLKPKSDDSTKFSIFMLCNEDDISVSEDEDEWESEDSLDDEEFAHYYLCPKCGRTFPEKNSKDCCGVTKIHLIEMPSRKNKNLCLHCGRNRPYTLKKLTTGENSSTEILTRTLYQLLPNEKKKDKIRNVEESSIYDNIYEFADKQKKEVESGKKLLMFSDSRQEAARFAMYMQARYNDWIWKNLIWSCINKLENDEELAFNDLVLRVLKNAQEYNLFEKSSSFDTMKSLVAKKVMIEFVEIRPRMSLARLGLINISFNIDIIDKSILQNFVKYGLSLEEVKLLFFELFDSLRKQGAVQFPDNVAPSDEEFEPRNRIISFKRQGGEQKYGKTTIGWLPSHNRSNRRLNYIKKILEKKGLNDNEAKEKATKILEEIYDEKNFARYFEGKGIVVIDNNNHLLLSIKLWRFSKPKQKLFICNKCGSTTMVNIEGVCNQTNCNGELVPIDMGVDRDHFYRETYKNMKPIPMRAEEHTAQLSSARATKVQNQFKNNEINILSCSTTFEMGVDIGSLESVVLRNVPPETANYVQRAGRAGRRNSSAALILTFARRRSHDLTYFREPKKMIQGIIKAPYLVLDNPHIVRRHLHSVIMAWFFANSSYYSHSAKSLVDDEQIDAHIALYNILQEKPNELLISLKEVLPKALSTYFHLEDWEWIKYLVNNENGNESSFDNAIESYKNNINEMKVIQKKYSEEQKYTAADYMKKTINTITSQDMISFLSIGGIIPRYGFPVDVVPLKILHHSQEATYVELDRDLRMAITEYAPGKEVVAGNNIWKPYALQTVGSKKWPTYEMATCKVCGKIHSYPTALGEKVENRQDMCCNKKLQYFQVVKPIFGFTTKQNELKVSKKVSANEVHYSSVSYFEGFQDAVKIVEKHSTANGIKIYTKYAPQGKMFIINKGLYAVENRGKPFKICPFCGYMTNDEKFPKTHETARGKICNGNLKNAYLGHNFYTDVILITLPIIKGLETDIPSLLFAIIEGACNALDIDRRELGGTTWGKDIKNINLVIFDTVPGGAGHVKRIQESLDEVFLSALNKVSGKCGCGEETSCYGCLRNYDNQVYHETMSRGSAKKYLEQIKK